MELTKKFLILVTVVFCWLFMDLHHFRKPKLVTLVHFDEKTRLLKKPANVKSTKQLGQIILPGNGNLDRISTLMAERAEMVSEVGVVHFATFQPFIAPQDCFGSF